MRIERFDIGFVVDDDWGGLERVAADRDAIAAATERVLACRDHFTCERNAEQIAALVNRIRSAS